MVKVTASINTSYNTNFWSDDFAITSILTTDEDYGITFLDLELIGEALQMDEDIGLCALPGESWWELCMVSYLDFEQGNPGGELMYKIIARRLIHHNELSDDLKSNDLPF